MYLLRENVRNAVRRAAQERMSSFGKIDKRKCKHTTVSELCAEYRANNQITKDEYELYHVKRGLRNRDGTGVMPVLRTSVMVHGYLISDGVKIPDSGRLTYRSMNVVDIINGCRAEGRFGFEEVVWLLIFGKLPDERQYNRICQLLYENRELPEYFPEDVIMKNPVARRDE